MKKNGRSRLLFCLIIGVSALAALVLGRLCWNMNFWPTDAEEYYMPAAKSLPSLKYLSQINQSLDQERIKWLHGKEMHVLAISLFQRAMSDTQTLRPLLVLGLTCVLFSSILLFAIARRWWGAGAATVVWFLFASSFWPYLYVLFVKHQTQGLMFFLLALFFIVYARHLFFFALAGVCMGISVFSSTVSVLYGPFLIAALLYAGRPFMPRAVLAALGFAAIVLYVNYPDIIGNLKSYWEYVRISGAYNHFFYNQKVLVQWLPYYDLKDTRGGWVWIIKYFILVMPIVFPLYLAAAFYVLRRRLNWRTVGLVLISFAPPVLAEIKGVAQYGANYFPSFFGFIMLIGYAAAQLMKGPVHPRVKNTAIMLAALQLIWNVFVFARDIYPSRMATTIISDFLQSNNIKELYTFANHPLRRNIVDHLNPSTLAAVKFNPIQSLIQAPSGYVLLPPVSTDTIYRGSNGDYNDFDQDLVLNQIIRQGKLRDYAVASFKTLGSSLIWSQEEEILAYRYLVLNQFRGGDLSRTWILDAQKIQNDRAQFLPTDEDLFMYRNHVSNIGTKRRQIMYTGHQGAVGHPTTVKGLAVRMFKMGAPKDSVRAFVFRIDKDQPLWKPYGPNFISQPVAASSIDSSPAGGGVVFTFDPPLQLEEGPFDVEIYRTGKPSDTDYYRIYSDVLGRVEQ